ncbi:MAG: cell division protein FtsZ [bacterium]|nr:cell division protein FtsZ [bacterium]
MVIEFDNFEAESTDTGLPVIKVIGVGGGGGNVVNRMVRDGIKKVQYVSANTDVMVLNSSLADITIPLGSQITKGLGAGMKPEVGQMAAEEATEQIQRILNDTDMVFIAAGMGGGTGTGAAPVIAELAKEKKILTVGVVTTPFSFEGSRRAKLAAKGIEELRKHVDTLMVIPNNKLLEIASQKTTMNEAFEIADDVLKQAISGITNLVNLEGVINLDFADLKTVMSNKGRAIMGTGVGHGENRGLEAAKKAISSPLLSDKPISGATGVIINIVADDAFGLLDAQAAADFIQSTADQDADVIFGLVSDPTKEDEVVITVIATGFDSPEDTARPVHHTPLRVVDSLRNKKDEDELSGDQETDEVAGEEQIAKSPAPEREKEVEKEVAKAPLESVENHLYYPDEKDTDQMKVEDYEIPSFMRKQRIQR